MNAPSMSSAQRRIRATGARVPHVDQWPTVALLERSPQLSRVTRHRAYHRFAVSPLDLHVAGVGRLASRFVEQTKASLRVLDRLRDQIVIGSAVAKRNLMEAHRELLE